MSSRSRRRRAPTAPATVVADVPAVRFAWWLIAALVLPRVIRIAYPYVWVEDDLYLESALAVARGLRPYLDFTHPQWPLLEWCAGLYVGWVGPSHRAMELLNAVAIFTCSALLVVVGRRIAGAAVGTAAALLFAWSSLVFRYHVWAREFFTAAFVLTAVAAVLDRRRSARWQVASVGVPLVLACAIKLTAVVSSFALLAFWAIGERRPGRAVAAGLTLAGGLLALGALCYRLYGRAFVFQALWFHLLKGRDLIGASPGYAASILDVLAPLALLGIVALVTARAFTRETALLTSMLAALGLFYGVISPTAWGHNYLEMLPFIAILSGAGLIWTLEALRSRAWMRSATAVMVIAVCLTKVTPFWNENSLRDSMFGFGFVPRAELADLAAAMRTATTPGDAVIAPSFIAFEADRLQWVRYPENYGVMRAAEEAVRRDGLLAARDYFGTSGFFDLINRTSAIWNDVVVRGIAIGGPVKAFIPDGAVQLLPLVNASPDALNARRFHLALRTAHFTLWVRSPAP